MKKKIKSSDLNLSPKSIGESDSKTVQGKGIVDETFMCGQTKMCVDTDYCDATYNCNVTFAACHTKPGACQSIRICPITYGNCETGNDCFQTGYNCPDTDKACQVRTEQLDCLTQNCGVQTADIPCLYTQQDTCAQTDGVLCMETSHNCKITEEDGCERPNLTVVVCPETTNDACIETNGCDSADTSC